MIITVLLLVSCFYCVGLKCTPRHIMFSETHLTKLLINTMMMIVKTWYNVTKCSNKLLYTLGDGVFGVAGQTKALFYWWIGFLEILHGATSHRTCQCENLRLLSHAISESRITRLFVHIAPLAIIQTEQSNSEGHQFWSENLSLIHIWRCRRRG